MADFNRGFDRPRGGSGRQWRDSSERSWRGEERPVRNNGSRDDRGERRSFGDRDERRGGFGRDDRGGRGFGRDDRGERRSFGDRDERRGGFGRDDRGGRGFGRDDRGERRSFGDRDERRGGFGRDERGGRGFGRDDRGERRSFGDRDERRGGFRRDERGERGFTPNENRPSFSGDKREARTDFKRTNKRDDNQSDYRSTDEYVSPTGDEPTIPAGVSADELDREALRALSTLTGANKDIVARHLVAAGQLIDLDAERAYEHAQAAVKRAGRVDVVREAAALTAYASGRYEEALREVRAVRRMRADNSLRGVEADAERGLGRPEKALAIIEETDIQGMDLFEQVELVLVSSGARADLGQFEVGLLLVDEALAQLPADTDPFITARLLSVKADRLRDLGREEEAQEVEAQIPDEDDDPEIIDIELFNTADIDRKTSILRGSDLILSEAYDVALLDLDGTAYQGKKPIEYAAQGVTEAQDQGMLISYVTNNAMRTAEEISQHLQSLGFECEPGDVMTSSMDVVALMKENIEDGSKVLVVGAQGLRHPILEAGYEIVESADDEPAAVVQGLDKTLNWERLSEAAFAIQRGATFFATNLDSTLPLERGFALGNGSLVKAVEHATGVHPIAAGKPEPGIFHRGAQLVGGEKPLAVGDRLDTDIAGACAAGIPVLHVLTGVSSARDVIMARRGQRPTYLGLDMRALNEAHPHPRHHKDGTWTVGLSQAAKVTKYGKLLVDGQELTDPVTLSLDTYRALAAAAWEYAMEKRQDVEAPEIHVVPNEDPHGYYEAPEMPEEGFDAEDAVLAAHADALPEAEEALTFLPGEEELEELLGDISDMDDVLQSEDN